MASSTLDKNEINYYELARRHLLNKSIIMSEVWPVPTIVVCYILFIFFGNRMMEKRDPFHLKFPMLAFNIFQISFNFYIFLRGYEVCYLFGVSKLVDLLDTVFMVLRKKTKHISILHLYHHILMAIICWAVLKFYAAIGEQLYTVIPINSFVHTIMYSYYFLSLLGPSFQKYLWWKKYLTTLQLVQFVVCMIIMGSLAALGCSQPIGATWFALSQGIVFFAMFLNFYIKNYMYPSSSAVELTSISEREKKL